MSEVRSRAELADIHMFLFSSLSADVCLSVQVYRWITLRKHWAFALNRQHRYSQLIFSLSGAAPANHTLYESDWESNRPFIYHGQAPLCLCACACSYYNGPKLCVTLFHFLLFKSCFWETAAAVQYKPPPMLLLLDRLQIRRSAEYSGCDCTE